MGIEFLRGGNILCAPLFQAVAANNVTVVPAVAGQIIRVFGFNLCSTTAALGSLNFKSGSGGPVITQAIVYPPNTVATPNVFWPITESGYFEVNAAGVALVCDVSGTGVAANVFYKVYSP